MHGCELAPLASTQAHAVAHSSCASIAHVSSTRNRCRVDSVHGEVRSSVGLKWSLSLDHRGYRPSQKPLRIVVALFNMAAARRRQCDGAEAGGAVARTARAVHTDGGGEHRTHAKFLVCALSTRLADIEADLRDCSTQVQKWDACQAMSADSTASGRPAPTDSPSSSLGDPAPANEARESARMVKVKSEVCGNHGGAAIQPRPSTRCSAVVRPPPGGGHMQRPAMKPQCVCCCCQFFTLAVRASTLSAQQAAYAQSVGAYIVKRGYSAVVLPQPWKLPVRLQCAPTCNQARPLASLPVAGWGGVTCPECALLASTLSEGMGNMERTGQVCRWMAACAAAV